MDFHQVLNSLVADDRLHARWLNTLSMMENTGARKISAAEDKTRVDLLMLKHAAEEARHAYYLKKQIGKLPDTDCPTYEPAFLLAPTESHAYLNRLDVQVCRYLKQTVGLKGSELKYAAYLLVTYAIEVRADELYPEYQAVLNETGSKVNVRSIIVEEEGHLAEMLRQMETFFGDWKPHAGRAVAIEAALYSAWLSSLSETLRRPVAQDFPK
ncbi:hypothetical protein [Larkinella soli]|uniref:hypothetical protein n=1 Tax=Larkinella soli TaxID=1770527 RepID=UPI000FFC1EA9|nr:hypothetical protein [Larkinella soli]